MKRFLVTLAGVWAAIVLVGGCASGTTEADALDMVSQLEQYGLADNADTPTRNDDGDMETTVRNGDCEIVIVDNGYELLITKVDGENIGAPIDLEFDGEEHLADICQDPDAIRWDW